jgi:Tfp pilus assembly protein PilN
MHFTDVDDIDFLPADVHVRRLRRRARRWRWSVVGAFVVLILLGLVGNRVQHARLAAERDRLQPQVDAVAALDLRLAAFRSEIDALGMRADVRARLRLRAATTRLLSAVTSPLPDDVSLTELRVTDSGAATSAPPLPPEQQNALPPERRDLDRMNLEAQAVRRVVTVRGLATDDATVSDYLDALRRTGSFDEVRLLFTDRHEVRGNELRSFSVELRVREPLAEALSRTSRNAGPNGGAL